MGFDDVYRNHESRIRDAKAHVDNRLRTLRLYMGDQSEAVLEANRLAQGKIYLPDRPEMCFGGNSMDFHWKFWNGEGHFNRPHDTELKLSGKFSWSPSAPDVIRPSGTNIIEGDIDLDDFVKTDLVEHMATLMSESLIALAERKYPHLG